MESNDGPQAHLLALFTMKTLRAGTLLHLVPELDDLKEVVEKNDWHNAETTWDHTWNVVKNSRDIFASIWFTNLAQYLESTAIDGRSKLDLLSWCLVLHDIAKPFCKKEAEGKTTFPGHEELGGEMARVILLRLGFTASQVKWMTALIRYHGDAHSFFGKPEEEFSAAFSAFARQHPHNLLELLLHSFADSLNSYEEVTNPSRYQLRIERYKNILDSGW